MNPSASLPHVPAPPFEPTSLLLDVRAGWRAAETAWQRVDHWPDGVLRLVQDSQAARRYDEAGDSFGGLAPPGNVAIADDGAVYLLDRARHRLRRFDPCHCEFRDVAGIGGEGGGAREWRSPAGITIRCGNLYVCDSGRETAEATNCTSSDGADRKIRLENHRISVFSLNGLALYGHLVLPEGRSWKPLAVAVSEEGSVYVSDALNGEIHLFSPMLRYVRRFATVAAPGPLAVDSRGQLYALSAVGESARTVSAFDRDGNPVPVPAQIDRVSQWFPALPFHVDAQGNLDMRRLCAERQGHDFGCGAAGAASPSHVFDRQGEPVVPSPAPHPVQYEKSGEVILGPLDSKIQGCVWHRVTLHGDLPQGAQVTVDTFTAEESIPANQLADFASRWETGQIAFSFTNGSWDCLARSGPGRYLWLRLTFNGNGVSTPAISDIEIEFPRIGSRQYLPAVFSAEAGSADFTDRYLALFDTSLRDIERSIDYSPSWFDPLSAPAERVGNAPVDFLTWLASWVGVRFDRSWSVEKRRQFLKRAGSWLDRRGTLQGLREALVMLLGLDRGTHCNCPGQPVTRCVERKPACAPAREHPFKWQVPPLVLEHFRVRRWLFAGQGRLGERSMLWGQRIINRSQLNSNAQADVTQIVARPDPLRDPFHSHAHQFTVFVPACVRDSEAGRKSLERLLASECPAHTRYYIEYVEPRFRIGVQSTLGFDAVVAAPPRSLQLGNQPLGQGVLADPAREAQAGRKLEIGKHSRVGITTRIH